MVRIPWFCAGLLYLLLALQLHAQELQQAPAYSGWYMGGSLDYIDFDGKYAGTDLPLAGDSLSLGGHSEGVSIFAGYDINDFFGVEMIIREGADVSGSKYSDIWFSEIAVMPRLVWTVSKNFSLYARAGIVAGSCYMVLGRTVPWADDEFYWSDIGLAGGIGAQIAMTDRVYLRLAYDYADLEMKPTDDIAYNGYQFYWVPDIDVMLRRSSLGLYYRF